MAEPVTIRDRIIDFRRVKASELIPHPDNFREHPEEQRAAYRAIVESVGIAGAELVRLLPDGRLMLIDGHMRREEHPDMELPVLVTDLNAEEAEQVLLTYDPLAAMAKTNAEKLDALLQRNNSDRPEIQRMMAELAERAGMYGEGGAGGNNEPPEDFASYDEDIETAYCCPKCGYRWSGKPNSDSE